MSVDINPGTYQGRLISVHMTESKNGVPCIEIKVNVEGENKERQLWLYFTGGATEISMRQLQANGFNGDFTSPQFDREVLSLFCKHEEYKGETNEKWYLSDWEPKELPADAVGKLNAMWKKGGYADKKASPPPMSTGVTPRTASREDAWDAFVGVGKSTAQWQEFIMNIVHGKEESDFNQKDWGAVMNAIESETVPF